MTMTIVEFTDLGDAYRIRVHLDNARMNRRGEPDPDFVLERTWGKSGGMTLVAIRREMKALCVAELAKLVRPEGVAVPGFVPGSAF